MLVDFLPPDVLHIFGNNVAQPPPAVEPVDSSVTPNPDLAPAEDAQPISRSFSRSEVV